MPRAEILSKQAIYTLRQLHGELAGKLQQNKTEAKRLRLSMFQVEAVMRLLEPGINVQDIAVKRRNKSNPWFKRGTLYRSALDLLRRAGKPMTARQITEALIAEKGVTPTRKQVADLKAGIQTSLRNHKGGSVVQVNDGFPVRWDLVR